jgi:Xaa-Pro dipeptidase
MPTAQQNALDVKGIQAALAKENLDGWLFYFFHGNDPLAVNILGLQADHFVSRRWFYLIPRQGEPTKLVHRIEMEALDSLPGRKVIYLGWKELREKLNEIIGGHKKIAMQYSPGNAIPYISRVDAGTIEMVQDAGVQVVSSANLVQDFEAIWSSTQLESHKVAADMLHQIVYDAFFMIRDAVKFEKVITEYDVQQHIMQRFEERGLETNSPPIVAVNEHSGSPHYQPTAEHHFKIKKGDFVLLDIWAKLKQPNSVYADITWTGFAGHDIPEKYIKIFDIVRGARDAAVDFVKRSISKKEQMYGWQVDDVARKYITDRGYGEYFVHRTGHSIGQEVHGNGANIDNLETRDERRLVPKTGFSIEPGIYLPEFGVRSEIDVYIDENDVFIGGQPIQTAIVPILDL